MLASIGRGLREELRLAQPMPDRLAELVRKIERSPHGSTTKDAPQYINADFYAYIAR